MLPRLVPGYLLSEGATVNRVTTRAYAGWLYCDFIRRYRIRGDSSARDMDTYNLFLVAHLVLLGCDDHRKFHRHDRFRNEALFRSDVSILFLSHAPSSVRSISRGFAILLS